MKEHPLPISKNILLILATFGCILIIIATSLKVTDKDFFENYSDLAIGIALLSQLIPWFVVIIDLSRNPIRNKLMWFVGIFMFGPFTIILYLLNREKHLRLYKKFTTI